MSFLLPDSIYSPQQIESQLLKLEQLTDFNQRTQARQRLKLQTSPDQTAETLQAELADLFAAADLDPTSQESIDRLQTELVQIKESTPVIHITLTAMPGPNLQQQLVSWFRLNIHPQLLVAFSYNRHLAGGMVVRTAAKIYDFSFRKRLLAGSDEMTRILRGA